MIYQEALDWIHGQLKFGINLAWNVWPGCLKN